MTTSGEKFIGVTGIGLALLGLNITFDSGEQSQKEHIVIHRAVEETKRVTKKISLNMEDILGRFKISIGGAKAHAASAPGNLDYLDYLKTDNAKKDLISINEFFISNQEHSKSKLLKELTNELSNVKNDYLKELRNISTVEIEIKRNEGLLLSHRRQMGILIAAIKMVNPPEKIYTFASKMEVMLNETI